MTFAENHFRSIQKRSADEQKAVTEALQRASRYSITELVNASLPAPMFSSDSKSLDAVFSTSKACCSSHGEAANGTWVPFAALAHRDLTTTNTTALFGSKINSTLEDTLSPVSAVVGAGATVISGVRSGNLILPAIDSALDVSSAWLGEGATAPNNLDPTFRQVTIKPYTLSVEIRFSRLLLSNSCVDLEAGLRSEILRAFMLEVDRVSFVGSGTNQPEGLLVRSDIPTIAAGVNGLAPTWTHLVTLEHTVAKANGKIMRGSFITNADVQKKLRLTQRATGLDFILSTDGKILGYPTHVSENVPGNLTKGTSVGVCSAALFGDFSELVIGFWGPAAVDLIVDGVTMAKNGIVRIIARADVGIAPRNAGAFAAMKDLLTT